MTTPPSDGDGTVSWRALQAEAARRLADAGLGRPEVDARWIVEEASGFEGAEYVLGLDQPATVRGVARFDRLVARRLAGEPLQYVVGSWAFRDLTLLVDPRVLIPRPETEHTVEVALREAARLGLRAGGRGPWDGTQTTGHVADLGTGSGAIALALATRLPDAQVWATDRSPAAVAVARANLAGAGSAATRVRLAEGDWFDALPRDLRAYQHLGLRRTG